MVKITLPPDLEQAATAEAKQAGLSPQELVLQILRRKLLSNNTAAKSASVTGDDWERMLSDAAIDCGVSLSDEAVSSEGLYD